MHIASSAARAPRASARRRGAGLFLALAAALATSAVTATANNAGSVPARPAHDGARPSESTGSAELADYFLQIETILFTPADDGATTARRRIEASRDAFWAQYIAASRLKVPVEARAPHRRLLEALRLQADSARRAALFTPASAPANDENIANYSHGVPDVGYGRDDQSQAACDLQRLATTLGQSLRVFGFCGLESAPRRPQRTLGSASAPVNDIHMLHDVAYDPGSGQSRPNVDGFQYSTIYAKAGKPIRIRFDNRNPAPFVFNIAIYDNASSAERVAESQRVIKSNACSGVRVHTVTATLRPGIYTYVDDVHPVAMRGRLIVVP